jgi:hypothetical protein
MDDLLESLADAADERLQRRIADAFRVSRGPAGEETDWRHLVFDEPPQSEAHR